MNPFALLDSLLADWASPRVRRLIHGLLALTAVGVSIWLAAEGDWKKALGALAVALYTGANKANTGSPDVEPEVSGNPEDLDESDDPLFYG